MPIIFEHESRQGVKNPNRDAAQAFYQPRRKAPSFSYGDIRRMLFRA
ncbi:hypothetical protein [Helicobacter ailurogastricus]|nr:hypothetical protein [Helicobacter ailurogastricus]